MKTAIAAKLFDRNRNASPESRAWVWPNNNADAEVNPDPRLLAAEIPGLTARLFFPDESVVSADVRAIATHDLVLRVPDLAVVPVRGQVVSVSLCDGSQVLLDAEKSVLHWSGLINKRSVVSLFMIRPNEVSLSEFIADDSRGEIRYPVSLDAKIESGDGRMITGRIVDYSLNGCRLVCEEALALDCEYHVTIDGGRSSVDVALRPRWSVRSNGAYQMGCTFRSDEGALLACRHQQSSAHKSELPRGPVGHAWDERR